MPAGDVVAKLVSAADEEQLLADIGAGFERLAADPDPTRGTEQAKARPFAIVSVDQLNQSGLP